MSQTIDQVYRDFNTQGVPASGDHKPNKAEIRALLKMIQNSGGQAVTRNTLSALQAVTPPNENYMGVVLTGTGAGYYSRVGGAWVFGRGFPDTFARVALAGSGAAQTGVVNTGINPASTEVFFAKVTTQNTGPMTLSVGGETALEVVNLAGNPLSAGEWTGMVMFYLNDANQYQLLIDAGAAASAAASATLADQRADVSAAAADRAEEYAALLGTATNRLAFKTVAGFLADTTMGYAGSGASIIVGSGDIFEAGGFRYEVAVSAATDSDAENAGGVKAYLREKDGVLYAPAIGAGGGISNDAPKIQKILDRQGEVVFPRDDYLIAAGINIPTGTGVTWAEGSRLVAGANSIKMVTSAPAAYFSQIRNLHVFGNGYGEVTGLDLTNFRLKSGIFNLRMESVYYGLIMRGGLFGTLIQNPTAYNNVPFPIRIIDNAATAKIENANFDGTGNVDGDGKFYGTGISIERNTGEGFFGNVNVLVDGGYIQGFGYGLYDQGYGTIAENTYFEAIENADIFADGAINPRYRGIQHWAAPEEIGGTHSKRGIMGRNTDGMIVDGPVMGSGGRSIGLFDIDASNSNCLVIDGGSNVGMNLPLGITTGVAQMLTAKGLSSMSNMNAKWEIIPGLAPSTPHAIRNMAGAPGDYRIVAYIPFSTGPDALAARAEVIWDGSGARVFPGDATNLTISVTGSLIFVSHTAAAAHDVHWLVIYTPMT